MRRKQRIRKEEHRRWRVGEVGLERMEELRKEEREGENRREVSGMR